MKIIDGRVASAVASTRMFHVEQCRFVRRLRAFHVERAPDSMWKAPGPWHGIQTLEYAADPHNGSYSPLPRLRCAKP